MSEQVVRQAVSCLDDIVLQAGAFGILLEELLEQVQATLGVTFTPEQKIAVLDAANIASSLEDPPRIFFEDHSSWQDRELVAI
jgi:hypothetical protein